MKSHARKEAIRLINVHLLASKVCNVTRVYGILTPNICRHVISNWYSWISLRKCGLLPNSVYMLKYSLREVTSRYVHWKVLPSMNTVVSMMVTKSLVIVNLRSGLLPTGHSNTWNVSGYSKTLSSRIVMLRHTRCWMETVSVMSSLIPM